MKNSKKGISLIVLVITIIVIIILAAAVLLSLQNNNPIENSRKATIDNDASELKSSLALYISNFMANDANHNAPFEKGKTIKIKETATNPKMAKTVNEDTTTSEEVSFSTLGIKSKAIKSATYEVDTGKLTLTIAKGYATPSNFDYVMATD